jgi:DNA-binding transcriptional ArsR family regulator
VTQELRRFKALAHPTRIAIVETLRNGEMSAGQIIEELELEQANASQHFTVLRSKQIVVNRKEGNQVFYSLRDPALIEVLEILKRYFYSQLSQTALMLKEIRNEKGTARK